MKIDLRLFVSVRFFGTNPVRDMGRVVGWVGNPPKQLSSFWVATLPPSVVPRDDGSLIA